MNFIRVAILLISIALVQTLLFGDMKVLNGGSTFRGNTNSNRMLLGNLPHSYTVKIFFNEDGYEHIHTHNGGLYSINVEVDGSLSILSSEQIKQINCDFDCSIYGENSSSPEAFFKLTQDVSIQRTITVVGNKSKSELLRMLRNDVINIILEKIRKT